MFSVAYEERDRGFFCIPIALMQKSLKNHRTCQKVSICTSQSSIQILLTFRLGEH